MNPALRIVFFHLQAAKEIAQTLAKAKNVTYMPGGVNMLMSVGSGR